MTKQRASSLVILFFISTTTIAAFQNCAGGFVQLPDGSLANVAPSANADGVDTTGTVIVPAGSQNGSATPVPQQTSASPTPAPTPFVPPARCKVLISTIPQLLALESVGAEQACLAQDIDFKDWIQPDARTSVSAAVKLDGLGFAIRNVHVTKGGLFTNFSARVENVRLLDWSAEVDCVSSNCMAITSGVLGVFSDYGTNAVFDRVEFNTSKLIHFDTPESTKVVTTTGNRCGAIFGHQGGVTWMNSKIVATNVKIKCNSAGLNPGYYVRNSTVEAVLDLEGTELAGVGALTLEDSSVNIKLTARGGTGPLGGTISGVNGIFDAVSNLNANIEITAEKWLQISGLFQGPSLNYRNGVPLTNPIVTGVNGNVTINAKNNIKMPSSSYGHLGVSGAVGSGFLLTIMDSKFKVRMNIDMPETNTPPLIGGLVKLLPDGHGNANTRLTITKVELDSIITMTTPRFTPGLAPDEGKPLSIGSVVGIAVVGSADFKPYSDGIFIDQLKLNSIIDLKGPNNDPYLHRVGGIIGKLSAPASITNSALGVEMRVPDLGFLAGGLYTKIKGTDDRPTVRTPLGDGRTKITLAP